jgi:Protein of unknown function (DUF664)
MLRASAVRGFEEVGGDHDDDRSASLPLALRTERREPLAGATVIGEEYLYFVDRALDGMSGIVKDLGYELANTKPALAGANSPYAILTHSLGVVEHWVGARVIGRPDRRDRPAEFRATGALGPLLERVAKARAQLAEDLASVGGDVPAAAQPDARFQPPSGPLTETGVLLHVLQELAQHHGQMEITRDLLTASGGVGSP